MLHPVFRLLIDAEQGARVQATTTRALRPTVVVPRELCLFENVSCAGVAWHELGSFAKVQALRLAPFASSGGSAAVRGKTLMLWFWDEAEVNPALERAGLDPLRTAKIAETLMLPVPRRDGAWTQPCSGGSDAMTLSAGAIVGSAWSPQTPGMAEAAVRLLRRPWASDRLGMTAAQGAQAGREAMPLARLLTYASIVAAVGCGAYATYWGGMVIGAKSRIDALEAQASETTSKLGDLSDWRQAEKTDAAWVANYRRLGAGLQLPALLTALARPLEAQGVVIKELEMRSAETRLLVVSAGPEIDLPGLLEQLAAVPGIEDVQLRQNAEPTQATYTMRTPGFISLNPLADAVATR